MRVNIDVPKSKIDKALNEKLEELKEENKRLKNQIQRVKSSVED